MLVRNFLTLKGRVEGFNIIVDFKDVSSTEIPLQFLTRLISMDTALARGFSKYLIIINMGYLVKKIIQGVL